VIRNGTLAETKRQWARCAGSSIEATFSGSHELSKGRARQIGALAAPRTLLRAGERGPIMIVAIETKIIEFGDAPHLRIALTLFPLHAQLRRRSLTIVVWGYGTR